MEFENNAEELIRHVLNNDLELVKIMIDADPRLVNVQTKGGRITPLIAAAGRGLVEMVDYLLSVPGIKHDLADKEGQTAFLHAKHSPEIQKKILEARPVPQIQSPALPQNKL